METSCTSLDTVITVQAGHHQLAETNLTRTWEKHLLCSQIHSAHVTRPRPLNPQPRVCTGLVTALITMPLFTSTHSNSQIISGDGERTTGGSTHSSGTSSSIDWIVATAHVSGVVQIWDVRLGTMTLIATIKPPSAKDGACKYVPPFLCDSDPFAVLFCFRCCGCRRCKCDMQLNDFCGKWSGHHDPQRPPSAPQHQGWGLQVCLSYATAAQV